MNRLNESDDDDDDDEGSIRSPLYRGPLSSEYRPEVNNTSNYNLTTSRKYSIPGSPSRPPPSMPPLTLPRQESVRSIHSTHTIPTGIASAKPFTISSGENALLKDIEKREEEHFTSCKYNTATSPRARGASVADELGIIRPRRASVESIDTSRNLYTRSKLQAVFNFIDLVVPKLQQRVNFYCVGFLIVCLFELSGDISHPGSWLAFFMCVMLIDLGTAIFDHSLFIYFIDRIFINHYKIAYLLHGFNGPLGVLLAILIVGESLKDFRAVDTMPEWSRLITAMAFVTVCACAKNWYVRKHYIGVLEKRFVNKLFKLETWNILLSELATMKPPKALGMSGKASTTNGDENRSEVDSEKGSKDVTKVIREKIGRAGENTASAFSHLQKKVIDVFADLVDATSQYNDDYEDDVDVITLLKAQMAARSTSGDKAAGGMAYTAALKSQIRQRKTFWELAARMSSNAGVLRILTFNGPVVIQRKFQAKAFGRSLYKHLSRGGKVPVTLDIIRRVFEEQHESGKETHFGGGENASWENPLHSQSRFNYSAVQMNSKDHSKDMATLLYESAADLFDPFNIGVVSEDQCVAALCVVYKEARFAASSLNEYGELHESLRTVMDVVFWLVMLVVLQVFLQLNLFTYLLPFVSLALTVSFALSSVLGNIFVAVVFVFFMMPFDIGNKIYIGADPNTRIVGFVRGVSLLYTTINTLKNEVMRIPNHSLFSEKICNLAESGGCVFEILLHFNFFSKNQQNMQMRIDRFLADIKQFVLVENQVKWQSCFIVATAVNSVENTVTYAIWSTHRDNWQEIGQPLLDHEMLIKYVKAKQEEEGLEFVKIKQAVLLMHHQHNNEEVEDHQNDSSRVAH
eukprot:scaffold1187_cov181-Ochromonas_danica.AAC.25